jgi:hypothetical protein
MKTSALATLLTLAVLSCAPLGGSTALGAADSDYTLRADDKLRIKIFQFPELTGEYTVTASGSISIPPIGEIVASGLSATDLSKEISSRFIKAGISDRPGATVEVIQSRPIYVFGDVQKPGEYTYRRGITVLQAISLAGGWYRPTDPGLMRLEREAITIRGDMRGLIRRHYYFAAERARLNAELEMKTELAFPPELNQMAAGDPAIAQLLDQERSFFRANIDAFRSQLDAMEKTLALYQMEIETASRQVTASKAQSDSTDKELKEVRTLLARNLVPIARQANLERLQAEIETARQGYQAQILRGQENVTQVEEKIFELKNQRQATLVRDAEKVGLDLEEVAVKLDTSRGLMAEVQFTAPNIVSRSSDTIMEARILSVVRLQNGKSVTFDAGEGTELFPGDVLKVEKSILPSGVAGRMKPGSSSFLVPTSEHE